MEFGAPRVRALTRAPRQDTWVVPGWFGGERRRPRAAGVSTAPSTDSATPTPTLNSPTPGSIPRGDPQGHYLAVQYNACTLLGLALHSLFLLQFSEPKHAKGRALLALLVAQLYLRKLYQVWEAGDMQPSALWFYAGVQLATVTLALPALLLKKPKSA